MFIEKKFGNLLRGGVGALGLLVFAGLFSGCGDGGTYTTTCGGGFVQASWTITGNGVPLSCAQAGAAGVDINVDSMQAPFSCDAHFGTTPAVTGNANHSISLTLLDSSGNVLSQTQTMTALINCNQILDIGDVEFSLTR